MRIFHHFQCICLMYFQFQFIWIQIREGVFIKRRKVYELNGILCTFTVFGSLFYLLSTERSS